MVTMNKGSALPRSLSSSEAIYLAPNFSVSTDLITVAIRAGSNVSYIGDHTVKDIRGWAKLLDVRGEDALSQLIHISSNTAKPITSGVQYPLIMGIVNVTPDSFSDGGEFAGEETAVNHAISLTNDGADILDFGGESTRPGADEISSEDELARVLPVIERCRNLGPILSIDTRKATVMDRAVKGGAAIINDVTALEYDARSMHVASKASVPVCLMHSSADPKVMQDNPQYDHVLFDVIDYLRERVDDCVRAGIKRSDIILDPGIGFGKTLDHNLVLLKGLRFFHSLGCPILLGVSRKSFIGKIDRNEDAKHRIGGSLSSLLYGLTAGVHIFRVHDVRETRQAIAIWQSIDNTSLTL